MEKTVIRRPVIHRDIFKNISTIASIIILVVTLVLINIIAGSVPWKYDMTFEKIFSLSDQTKNVLDSLNKNINIVAFYQEGKEDATVKVLLDEYVKAGNGKIKVEYADAEKSPMIAKKYDKDNQGVLNESIIFESEGNIKKINSSDIYTLNNAYGKSFSGEQQFTGAILYVASPRLSKVYFIEGHQETNMNEELFKLKGKIEAEASVVEGLNMIKSGGIPGDADAIVVVSPKRDIGNEEKEVLKEYLSTGGRALFLFDVLGADAQLPNFSDIMKTFGIGVKNNFVVENDRSSFYSNNNMYLVPNYTEHAIVEGIKSESLAIILPYSLNLELLKSEDRNLIVEPILKTSDKSWSRYNLNDASPDKGEGDVAGPADVAVSVTRDNTDDRYRDTKIVVVGNAKFIENSMLDIQGNIDLFMNSLNWIMDKKDAISIRAKMMNSNQLIVKGAGYIALLAVSILVIPMLAFGTGLIIWLRRRHS